MDAEKEEQPAAENQPSTSTGIIGNGHEPKVGAIGPKEKPKKPRSHERNGIGLTAYLLLILPEPCLFLRSLKTIICACTSVNVSMFCVCV